MDTKSSQISEQDYERSLGFLVHDVARLMRLAFERRVRDIGLTRAQWFVLAYLIRTDGQKQSDLADETDMEKAPLGKLLDRLEEGGWIERRPDPDDRRAKRIHKTDKVDPLIDVMPDVTGKVYDIALEGLERDARECLVDDLVMIKRNLLAAQNETDQA